MIELILCLFFIVVCPAISLIATILLLLDSKTDMQMRKMGRLNPRLIT